MIYHYGLQQGEYNITNMNTIKKGRYLIAYTRDVSGITFIRYGTFI